MTEENWMHLVNTATKRVGRVKERQTERKKERKKERKNIREMCLRLFDVELFPLQLD